MANLSSIARPYALAAFEYARQEGKTSPRLSEWKAFLDAASYVADQPDVTKLLANPQMTKDMQLKLFQEVLAPLLNEERKNFLMLLAQNNRFIVLPDIAKLFHLYYAALEKISTIRVITAVDIQESYLTKLTEALKKRMRQEVILKCETDPSIIGGAILHLGDSVIDGSVRGKLTRLLQNLTG